MCYRTIRANDNPVVEFVRPSLVRREFAADADINNLVRKFLRTGTMPQPNLGRPTIADATDIPGDFAEAAGMAYEQMQSSSEAPAEAPSDLPGKSEGEEEVSNEGGV